MLKKILMLSLFSIISSTALADVVPYAGVDVGYNWGNWRLTDPTSTNYNFNDKGYIGGLILGIGTCVNQAYFALEGFGDGSLAQSKRRTINLDIVTTTRAKIYMKYSYGGSVIGGWLYRNTGMLYGRLGFIRTRFDLKQSVVPPESDSTVARQKPTGGQAGIGVQGFIMPNVSLRAEYDYVAYQTFTAFDNKVQARDNQVRLGIIYNFT